MNFLYAEAVGELRALADDLRRLLATVDLSTIGRRDLARLLRDIETAITERYQVIAALTDEALAEVEEAEWAWALALFGVAATATAALAAARARATARRDRLLLGLPLDRWWQRQATNAGDRIGAIVRTVAAGGLPAVPGANSPTPSGLPATAPPSPAEQVIRAVIGAGPRGRERGGAMETERTQAGAIIRTAVRAGVTDAQRRAWGEAGVRYLKWHSILDTRTTIGCGVRAGKLYTLDLTPVHHDIPIDQPPPRHFNCRSLLAPMAPDFVPPGDGQDPYTESLDAWLKRQPEAVQDEMLGAQRAALWRAGKLDARGLLGQSGETLSVSELIDRHATPETQIALWWKRPRGDLVVARVPEELRESMRASSREAVLTDYFRKKQLANHPDMDAEIYTRLPAMLGTPRVAVKQRQDDVLLVDDGGRPLLIVLRPDRRGRILVRSVHYIRQRELDKLRQLQPIVGSWD